MSSDLLWRTPGSLLSRSVFSGLALLAAMALAMPLALLASADGPEPGYTGGFTEPTCHDCHFENPIDDPMGSLALTGLPDLFTPGSPYRLEISLERPGLARGGFQLAARFSSGPHQGEQAGRFEPLDDRTQVLEPKPNGIQYVEHSALGSSSSAAGSVMWTVRWTAPSKPDGSVVFHLAANASNNDDSQFGDFVYTQELVSRVAR